MPKHLVAVAPTEPAKNVAPARENGSNLQATTGSESETHDLAGRGRPAIGGMSHLHGRRRHLHNKGMPAAPRPTGRVLA
jgi:hypothetical protein